MEQISKNKIAGYAILWGVEYEYSDYIEVVDRNCLKNADMSAVMALREHNTALLLGKNNSGTTKLAQDQTGLIFEITLPDTQLGAETMELVRRGDLVGCSWGFSTPHIDGSTWRRNSHGQEVRTIVKVHKLYDVSLCALPANPKTAAWVSEKTPGALLSGAGRSAELPRLIQSQTKIPAFMDSRSSTKFGAVPFYECASHGVENEARHRVVEIAKRRHSAAPSQRINDGMADTLAKIKITQDLAAKHEEERRRRAAAVDRSPAGIVDTLKRLKYSQDLAAKYAQPLKNS